MGLEPWMFWSAVQCFDQQATTCWKADNWLHSKHSNRCCRMSSWLKVSSRRSSPRAEWYAAAMLKRPQSIPPPVAGLALLLPLGSCPSLLVNTISPAAPQCLESGFLETDYHREELPHHCKLLQYSAFLQEWTEFVQLHVFWRKEELNILQVQNDLWL